MSEVELCYLTAAQAIQRFTKTYPDQAFTRPTYRLDQRILSGD
jgi:hypothetical protein